MISVHFYFGNLRYLKSLTISNRIEEKKRENKSK
nr:MAG TPA: hypothetical protein [Caudoviricetes sp.]